VLSKDLVRDPGPSIDALFRAGDKIATKADLWIYFPSVYVAKGLAYVGSEISVVGIMLTTTDNKRYGSTMATAMLDVTPERIDTVNIDDEEHYRMFFPKGSVVFPDPFPKKVKGMVDMVFDTFYMYGKNPWWLTREDFALVLSDSVYWNDMRIHDSQVTLDVLASQISRSKSDIRKFARHESKRPESARLPATTAPIRNGSLNRTSRMTLLTNSELKKGMRAALLNEPVREEFLENLFMK
jgi:hypothetical protein